MKGAKIYADYTYVMGRTSVFSVGSFQKQKLVSDFKLLLTSAKLANCLEKCAITVSTQKSHIIEWYTYLPSKPLNIREFSSMSL